MNLINKTSIFSKITYSAFLFGAIIFGAAVLNVSDASAAKAQIYTKNATDFLKTSVWRASDCDTEGNFQTFILTPSKQLVEVGAGKKGEGEQLQLLKVDVKAGFVDIETRVCAPVGCNHTVERYKIINQNTISEWDFTGYLPDNPPLVVLKDGIAQNDGSKGRIFNRCAK